MCIVVSCLVFIVVSCLVCIVVSCLVYFCSCLVCIVVFVLCQKSVFGRSCDRPPRHRFSSVSLCL